MQLVIKDFGLLESTEVDLGAGLQVITGETGVGKSMLLSTLGLLRGDRARPDAIRTGCDEALVSGFFVVDPTLARQLEEQCGLELPEGEILIERRLRRAGRARSLVNGRDVPLAQLRELGTRLLEVQGQRSQLGLLDPRAQRQLVDHYAGLANDSAEFAQRFREARALADRIETISATSRERNDRRLFLAHVVAELDEASLRPGERAAIERELEFLEERERLQQLVRDALVALHDRDGNALDEIASHRRALGDCERLHAGFGDFLRESETAHVALDEAVRALRNVEEELDQDPHHLDEQRARFELLMRLEERYHRSGDELLSYLEEVRSEHASLVDDEEELPALEEELRGQLNALGKAADRLGKRRKAAAAKLAKQVTGEFPDLGLPAASFGVQLTRLKASEGWHGLRESGREELEFQLAPNPGEPPQSLRETASGGELSRVMLSLRRALAEVDPVPVLVFDEIDAGVGGRLGSELGRKLQAMSRSRQVLCVTHLPQIASFGAGHHRVSKLIEGGRTRTVLEPLAGDRRVEELAEMIRGEGRTTTSLREAREMLAEGAEHSEAASQQRAAKPPRVAKKKRAKTRTRVGGSDA
ncbi:MAG: DNA repair protein RecN [Planctomycetota bacterium]